MGSDKNGLPQPYARYQILAADSDKSLDIVLIIDYYSFKSPYNKTAGRLRTLIFSKFILQCISDSHKQERILSDIQQLQSQTLGLE